MGGGNFLLNNPIIIMLRFLYNKGKAYLSISNTLQATLRPIRCAIYDNKTTAQALLPNQLSPYYPSGSRGNTQGSLGVIPQEGEGFKPKLKSGNTAKSRIFVGY